MLPHRGARTDWHHDASGAEEHRLAEALAFAGAGAWEYDLVEERTIWHENVDTLLGIENSPSAFTLTPLMELVHPDDRSGVLDSMEAARRLQRAGRTGRVEFDDFRVCPPDGSVRWLRNRSSVTEGGTLEGVIVDVTQRRADQEHAHERTQRFDALVSASPDVIMIVGRDGRMAFVSDAVEELVGRASAEIVGRDAAELVDEFVTVDSAASAHTIVRKLLSGEQTDGYVELWMHRPDGELFLAEFHVRAVTDASGGPDGFVTVLRDITHHVRAQQELIEARDAAEAGVRAKNQFLARTSHELRTPMNSVLGFAQLLEMEQELSRDARSSVEYILRAGRHLLVLLDDVLDLARTDSGALRPASEAVDVRAVVTDSVRLVRSRAAEHDTHIGIESGCPSAVVRADAHRLRQVLVNLLVNAIAYNHASGDVDVRWSIVADAVRIDVRDTGPGIAEADLERLFVPFERLDADERGIPGTGLGLSLSRSLVDAMGGRLDVASTPGKGSTFSVTLALEASTDAADPTVTAHMPRASTRGRIVYIDDNAANLMLVRKGLSHLPGIALLTATDARSGLELVRRELPDLVLLDLQFPDGRGEDVLAEIQRNPAISAIPVVVLSSDSSPRAEAELRLAGVAEYLQKPLDVPALLALVDRMLSGGAGPGS